MGMNGAGKKGERADGKKAEDMIRELGKGLDKILGK
jgi:hypothetical protein